MKITAKTYRLDLGGEICDSEISTEELAEDEYGATLGCYCASCKAKRGMK